MAGQLHGRWFICRRRSHLHSAFLPIFVLRVNRLNSSQVQVNLKTKLTDHLITSAEFRNSLEQARCGGSRKTHRGCSQARSGTPPSRNRQNRMGWSEILSEQNRSRRPGDGNNQRVPRCTHLGWSQRHLRLQPLPNKQHVRTQEEGNHANDVRKDPLRLWWDILSHRRNTPPTPCRERVSVAQDTLPIARRVEHMQGVWEMRK